MKPTTRFVRYLLEVYGVQNHDDGMHLMEACKYTRIYKKLFPNLWSGGDSFDRENVYKLFLMGRADSVAREHKEMEVK